MSPIEREIRQQLGVPENVSSVLFLGMDAHMDWDWLNTFHALLRFGNLGQTPPQEPVRKIIDQAWKLMIKHPGNQTAKPYMYSVCEMGFLRAALEHHPDFVQQFRANSLGEQLGIQGGGITSPDNLLTHGEAFIRNYLVGWAWQRATLGLSTSFAYLPDDFGHDAQLPVMLEAMGFAAVCFSRLPGSWDSSQTTPLDRGTLSLYSQLIGTGEPNPNGQTQGQGSDLYWQASDGSTVFAHVEQNGYQQGNSIGRNSIGRNSISGDSISGDSISGDSIGSNPNSGNSDLTGYLHQNQPSSLSPYIYVPCGNDFAAPISNLLELADTWNNQSPAQPTYVVVGTLGQYIEAVMAWSQENPTKLVTRSMDPTPYWTGFYASRPANKILHQATVRALLGAEVFGVIADLLQPGASAARQIALAQGWEDLVPSTHHDYITGTAVDDVYAGEQLPLLKKAEAEATGARTSSIEAIAALIDATPGRNEVPVAVFNQLGFDTTGLVEIPALPGQTFQSVRPGSGNLGPVQITPCGRLLFMASVPSLGYATYYLSNQSAGQSPSDDGVSVTLSESGDVTLQNGQVKLVVSAAAQWGITSLQPIVSGQLQPDLLAPGKAANVLTFYNDPGNIYNFGNEFIDDGFTVSEVALTSLTPAQTIEIGPLRARVQTQVHFSDGTSQATYTIEYTLIAGEPFVRMAVTGSAPLLSDGTPNGTPYAVMVKFPFLVPIDGVIRGTPYHWHDQLPVPYWKGPTFQATHHFVVPTATGAPQCALYHSDIPAWAIDERGAMIGCILRNTPGPTAANRGADGTDSGVHTHRYALRIPQGVELPAHTLSLFKESLSFATPLQGAIATVPSGGVTCAPHFSLASVASGEAIITAAKWTEPVGGAAPAASLILRLYQPSNSSQPVALSLAGYLQLFGGSQPPQVVQVTALEQPLPNAQPLPVTNGQVALTMARALATLAVSPMPGGAAPSGEAENPLS